MSIVPKETIEVIAQSIGISNFSPDVAPALATDVEYRVREIMQVATQFVRLLSNLYSICSCLCHPICINAGISPSLVQILFGNVVE